MLLVCCSLPWAPLGAAGAWPQQAVPAFYVLPLLHNTCSRAVLPTLMPPPLPPQVVVHNLRPEFPSYIPAAYAGLAQRCWAKEPSQRPSMKRVLAELQRMAASAPQLQDAMEYGSHAIEDWG
jgi:hypothetical protein